MKLCIQCQFGLFFFSRGGVVVFLCFAQADNLVLVGSHFSTFDPKNAADLPSKAMTFLKPSRANHTIVQSIHLPYSCNVCQPLLALSHQDRVSVNANIYGIVLLRYLWQGKAIKVRAFPRLKPLYGLCPTTVFLPLYCVISAINLISLRCLSARLILGLF